MSGIDTLDFTLDSNNLYREELITDGKAGALRRMTPITADGSDDPGRPVLFQGQAQVYTQAGPLPLNFELPVTTLAEAVAQFGPEAKKALEETLKELQELPRQQASSLVVPGASGMPPMGGAPGGGKIQLR